MTPGGAGPPDQAYRREAAKLSRAELPILIDTIERAATVRRPRLRWPVGPNAFSAAYLRPLTPDWLYELVIRIVFRRRRSGGSVAPH